MRKFDFISWPCGSTESDVKCEHLSSKLSQTMISQSLFYQVLFGVDEFFQAEKPLPGDSTAKITQ